MFRRRRGQAEFLALKRARRKTLPGVWQPVTGKIERLETVAEAALREVHEETGLVPKRWWRLEGATLSLDAKGRSLMVLPLLAAEVGASEPVRLSREHVAFRFVGAREAARLYLWDSQREGLAAVGRQILPGGAPKAPRTRAAKRR